MKRLPYIWASKNSITMHKLNQSHLTIIFHLDKIQSKLLKALYVRINCLPKTCLNRSPGRIQDLIQRLGSAYWCYQKVFGIHYLIPAALEVYPPKQLQSLRYAQLQRSTALGSRLQAKGMLTVLQIGDRPWKHDSNLFRNSSRLTSSPHHSVHIQYFAVNLIQNFLFWSDENNCLWGTEPSSLIRLLHTRYLHHEAVMDSFMISTIIWIVISK